MLRTLLTHEKYIKEGGSYKQMLNTILEAKNGIRSTDTDKQNRSEVRCNLKKDLPRII